MPRTDAELNNTISTHRTVASPLIWPTSTSRGTSIIATSAEINLAVLASVVVGTIACKVPRRLGTGGGSGIVAKLKGNFIECILFVSSEEMD